MYVNWTGDRFLFVRLPRVVTTLRLCCSVRRSTNTFIRFFGTSDATCTGHPRTNDRELANGRTNRIYRVFVRYANVTDASARTASWIIARVAVFSRRRHCPEPLDRDDDKNRDVRDRRTRRSRKTDDAFIFIYNNTFLYATSPVYVLYKREIIEGKKKRLAKNRFRYSAIIIKTRLVFWSHTNKIQIIAVLRIARDGQEYGTRVRKR